MGKIKELTSKDFDEFLDGDNCIVDFWAEWCNPCKVMEPHIKKAAEELKDRVKIGKVNVDDEPDLAQRFQVMSIPTIIFFNNKEQVDRASGALNQEEIVKRAKDNF
jgi:thioredoxin 1